MRRGFISLFVLGGIAVVCLICLAIIARNWSCRKPRPPRPPRIVTAGPFEVIRADTGATLIVQAGRKRRPQEKTITLEKIAAPATGEWVDVSRDHLKELAGTKVTVQYEKHGIFRSGFPMTTEAAEREDWKLVDCDKCGGTGKVSDTEAVDCPFCWEKPNPSCPHCKGTKKLALDWFTLARCQLWMSKHIDQDKCKHCNDELCPVATKKLQEIIAAREIKEPQMVQCPMCGGKGRLYVEPNAEEAEARVPLVGVVFGESNINLNLAMIEGGYARCQEDAPKEWVVAGQKAEAAKKGMWSK